VPIAAYGGRAGCLPSLGHDPDAGISAKYGVTSAITVEGTVNPDFSQVESDSFQVEVNQRFPVFYPEKRPFFMEGMGTFELAGAGGDSNMRTAVHTRVIVDPLWGAKSSGSAGRATFAMLAAGDEARLQGPRLGVEAGVEDRRVGLARAGAHVDLGLDQRQAQVEAGKLPGDRRADVAGADDRDVAVQVGAHRCLAPLLARGCTTRWWAGL